MADITIKSVPDEIGEERVKEWVGILVERYHASKINSIPAVVTAQNEAKVSIDAFKTANNIKDKASRGESNGNHK